MSKPSVELPAPYVAKMQAIVNAQLSSDVFRTFGILKSTWHSVLSRRRASELIIERLNPFFINYGVDRLHPLDFVQLKRAELAPQGTRELLDVASVDLDRRNLTGDAWRDIRALYLDRRNDEALVLAHSGLVSNDIETRLASAQSLIYLNHRLGRLSAMASAVNALRRTAAEYPNLFPNADRIRTATDIAKCLSAHDQPLLALPLFRTLEEFCRPSHKLLPGHIKSSLMRGVSECRYFLGDSERAHRDMKFAVELASDGAATSDDTLSNANSVALYSTERSLSFKRNWTNLAGELARLEDSLHKSAQRGSDDGALPRGVSLVTLTVVLVTSAFSSPHLNETGTFQLLDQRADDLFRSGLADDKILPCGFDKLLLQRIPNDGRPARRILRSLVKNPLPPNDAKNLSKLARELLDSVFQ